MTEGVEWGFLWKGEKASPLKDACAHACTAFGPCSEVGDLRGNPVELEDRFPGFEIPTLPKDRLVLGINRPVKAAEAEDENEEAGHATTLRWNWQSEKGN